MAARSGRKQFLFEQGMEMTDKTYTAEQVAHHASIVANGGYPNAAAMLATFAATLRQQAGAVDEAMVERACIAESGECDDDGTTSWDRASDKEKGYARNRVRRILQAALAGPASSEPTECCTDFVSSRVCQRGTKSCIVNHKASSGEASGEAVATTCEGATLRVTPAEPVKVPEADFTADEVNEVIDAALEGRTRLVPADAIEQMRATLLLAAAPGADGETYAGIRIVVNPSLREGEMRLVYPTSEPGADGEVGA